MKFVISVEKIKPIIKNYSRFVDEAKIKVNSDGIESLPKLQHIWIIGIRFR